MWHGTDCAQSWPRFNWKFCAPADCKAERLRFEAEPQTLGSKIAIGSWQRGTGEDSSAQGMLLSSQMCNGFCFHLLHRMYSAVATNSWQSCVDFCLPLPRPHTHTHSERESGVGDSCCVLLMHVESSLRHNLSPLPRSFIWCLPKIHLATRSHSLSWLNETEYMFGSAGIGGGAYTLSTLHTHTRTHTHK